MSHSIQAVNMNKSRPFSIPEMSRTFLTIEDCYAQLKELMKAYRGYWYVAARKSGASASRVSTLDAKVQR